MKNTILVAAATAFVTTVLVLFIVAMTKGHGCNNHCGKHQMQMHHGGMGHDGMKCGRGHGGHGMHKRKCDGTGKKACSGKCKSAELSDENIQIEKKVIVEKEENTK